MMTRNEQNATRARFIQGMLTNAVPLNGGNVQFACAAILNIITPAVCGGMFALPAPDQAPGWMLTDEEIATMPYCGDGIAPELRA